MKIIVLSGINLFEGGPISIYYDCLDTIIEEKVNKNYKIIAFVHKKNLFKKYFKQNIEFIEIPKSRNSYLYRLFYEYIFFYFWSRKKNIDIWFSLHDITPNVVAKKRYVYCHNALPISELKKMGVSNRVRLYSFIYKYFYKINIKKNDNVIVQQNWIKEKFNKLFKIDNVIVCKPIIKNLEIKKLQRENDKKLFFFPSLARTFKNFEVIFNSCKILNCKGIYNYEVILTIDGSENNYSKKLREQYSNIKEVIWYGSLKRDEVFSIYSKTDALIFPSKIETWGLPITEFKATGKPILLSDLEYSHETIGNYEKVKFFDPMNANELADIMLKVINDEIVYDKSIVESYDYIEGWNLLIKYIVNN